MNSVNLAAVGASKTPRGRRAATPTAKRPLTPRLAAALQTLLEGYLYAQDLEASSWEFATEIASLRRLKLTNSDLRWLVRRRLVEHGVEVTAESDPGRSFEHPAQLRFSKRTCFVLTAAGAELAATLGPSVGQSDADLPAATRSGPSLAIAATSATQQPTWDRDRLELRVGAALVKRYQIPSANEESVLAAFDEENWPPQIDDPLPAGEEPARQARLQATIESLNRNQKQSLIRFSADCAGRGVAWQFSAHTAAPQA